MKCIHVSVVCLYVCMCCITCIRSLVQLDAVFSVHLAFLTTEIGVRTCEVFFFVFFFFFFFRAAPTTYGGSQARRQIEAVASHSHSHSNVGSKLHLQSTPQLTAMPDP